MEHGTMVIEAGDAGAVLALMRGALAGTCDVGAWIAPAAALARTNPGGHALALRLTWRGFTGLGPDPMPPAALALPPVVAEPAPPAFWIDGRTRAMAWALVDALAPDEAPALAVVLRRDDPGAWRAWCIAATARGVGGSHAVALAERCDTILAGAQ
jgi:hypothetical protein